MQSFFQKSFHFKHRYPIKVWTAATINDVPYSVSFDGATLRQINLITKRVAHSVDYHHLNAYSICIFMQTNIYKYENLFLLVKNQRNIEIFDSSLNHIPQFDFDTGSAIITAHWHKPTDRLFVCGTNGWLRCFHVTCHHKVTEFVATWTLEWEIRSTPDWITCLAHDDFTQILYGVVEKSLFAWDLRTGDFKYRLPHMHDRYKIFQVEVDPESSVVITSGLDGYIRTWDIKELECKNLNSFEVAPKGHVAFFLRDRFIVTMGNDRIIKFYQISDSTLKCQINMADPSLKPNPEEVIIPQIMVLDHDDISICITSYKDDLETAKLGYAPEAFLSADAKITALDWYERDKTLLCLCENNFVLTYKDRRTPSKTIDLDIPNTNKCKRCCASQVSSFCVDGEIIYAGYRNGSLKCINIQKKECIMLEEVPLDQSIDYVTTVCGLFVHNHPFCNGETPVKTPPDNKFIVGYTSKGVINVWCANCKTHLLFTELKRTPISCAQFIPEKSVLFLAAQKTIGIYKIDAYDFNPFGEISTSGNQVITSFSITKDMELIYGTNSGEIMIFQIEETMDQYHFSLKHHIPLEAPVFKIFMNEKIGKPVIGLKNGTLVAINQETGKIISEAHHADSEHITAMYFQQYGNETSVGAYLAFGSRIHFNTVDTYEDPIVVQAKEEEEEEEMIEIHEEDTEDAEENIIKYIDESHANISRLMGQIQKESQKKKRIEYIPEMETTIQEPQPETPVLVKKKVKRKPTYHEVMEKNRMILQEALEKLHYERPATSYSRPINKLKSKSRPSSSNRKTRKVENEDENELNLTIKPFFYTENSSYMVSTEQKSQETKSLKATETESPLSTRSTFTSLKNLSVTERSLVYENNDQEPFQAAIDETDEYIPRTTPGYIPPGGRFIINKPKPELVKAPIIIKKIFVGPPVAPRVLFNDPTTLNGLNFYDPRGFGQHLGVADESETSSTTESVPESVETTTSTKTEEEDDDSEEDQQAVLPKEPLTDLEKRRLMKKKRVSITSQMTAPKFKPKPKPKPSVTQQPKKDFMTNKINDTPFKPKPMQTPKNQPNTISRPLLDLTYPTNHTQPIQKVEPKKPPIVITNAKIPENTQPTQNVRVQFNFPQKEENSPVKTEIPKPETPEKKEEPKITDTAPTNLTTSSEIIEEPEPKIIDLKMKHQIRPTKRRKALNQPIRLKNKESPLHQLTKNNKLNEQEKYVKPKPVTPPHKLQSHDDNSIVKASMVSPRPGPTINKNASSSLLSSSMSSGKKNKGKAPKSNISDTKPNIKPVESSIKKPLTPTFVQDDTVVLPETQTPEIQIVDEQARINQLRRQKLQNGNLFDLLFTSNSAVTKDESGKETNEIRFYFPQLMNLERFWEEKIVLPKLPFEFGNPNTANHDQPVLFAGSINKIYPEITPRLFAGTAQNGINDLLKRFEKTIAYNRGEIDSLDDLFEQENQDILSNVPVLKRRLSFS